MEKKDNKYKYINKHWTDLYYDLKDLYPLKKHKLGKLSLYGSNKPKPYLDNTYGTDWNTVYIIERVEDHILIKKQKQPKIPIQK